MGAPTGNQFWKLRSKHGRDTLFASAELLWKAATEYFNWVDGHPWYKVEQLKKPYTDENGKTVSIVKVPTARPYTTQGLCLYLNCNTKYFNEFAKELDKKLAATLDEEEKKRVKDFSEILTRIRETIFQQKFEGAAVGAFNSNLIARELGIADKQESRNVDKEGNDVPPPTPPPTINIQVWKPDTPIAEKEEE